MLVGRAKGTGEASAILGAGRQVILMSATLQPEEFSAMARVQLLRERAGQNQWDPILVGRCTTHFRANFSGDWDVHW